MHTRHYNLRHRWQIQYQTEIQLSWYIKTNSPVNRTASHHTSSVNQIPQHLFQMTKMRILTPKLFILVHAAVSHCSIKLLAIQNEDVSNCRLLGCVLLNAPGRGPTFASLLLPRVPMCICPIHGDSMLYSQLTLHKSLGCRLSTTEIVSVSPRKALFQYKYQLFPPS